MTPAAGKPPMTAFSRWLAKKGIGSEDLAIQLTRKARQHRISSRNYITHRAVRSWRDGSRNPNPVARVLICQLFEMSQKQLDRLLDQ